MAVAYGGSNAEFGMRNAKAGRKSESEPGAIATGFHRIADRRWTTAGRRSARLSQKSPRGTLFSKWDNIFAAIAGNRAVTLSHFDEKRDKSGTRLTVAKLQNYEVAKLRSRRSPSYRYHSPGIRRQRRLRGTLFLKWHDLNELNDADKRVSRAAGGAKIKW